MLKSQTPPSANDEIIPPFYEDLSPDLQWQIYQGHQRSEHLLTLTSIALTLGLLTPVLVPQLNDAAETWVSKVIPGRSAQFNKTVTLDPGQPIQAGQVIAGHRVTSGYGPRPTAGLPDGASEQHRGIDLATAPGTQLHAIGFGGRVKVRCWQDRDGGGLVADIYPELSETYYQALHLSQCATGIYDPGQVFAQTGGSGVGTGPHLDWRERRKSDKQHLPPTSGPLVASLTGVPPVQSFHTLELACRIGRAEGTRDGNCAPTWAYWGHTDPGNGAANLGSFSYQHGASSPEEADQKQQDKLNAFRAELNTQAIRKFGKPLSLDGAIAALDLFNQSEAAGRDFVKQLPTATPTKEQIITARSQTYINPATGQLDAPGLGNNEREVKADQTRRTEALLAPLKINGSSKLD